MPRYLLFITTELDPKHRESLAEFLAQKYSMYEGMSYEEPEQRTLLEVSWQPCAGHACAFKTESHLASDRVHCLVDFSLRQWSENEKQLRVFFVLARITKENGYFSDIAPRPADA